MSFQSLPLKPPKNKIRWYKWRNAPTGEEWTHEKDEVLHGRWGKLKLRIYCLGNQGPQFQFDIWEPDGSNFAWEPFPLWGKKVAVKWFEKELPKWFIHREYHKLRINNTVERLRTDVGRALRKVEAGEFEAAKNESHSITQAAEQLKEVAEEKWWLYKS